MGLCSDSLENRPRLRAAPSHDPSPGPKQRCSNAMTGHILLDLCQMTQGTMAERCGQTAESTFLHPVTVRNLQHAPRTSLALGRRDSNSGALCA